MNKWAQIPDQKSLERTVKALLSNGIETIIVENREEAKEKIFQFLPKGAGVMNMTSVTLDTLSISQEINELGNFASVRNKLSQMDSKTQGQEKKRIGAAPQYAVGSVHAVTEDGHVLIASQSGSQLPGYVYGSKKVIWVVGGQKIVKNTEEGIKRIYEYVLPLEDARAQKAYGSGSAVNKLLIFNRETVGGRVTMILVKEKLGF